MSDIYTRSAVRSERGNEIYAAIAAVMADVSHVAKRDVNQHQRFNFRGIDAVVNAVGPILRKHQVVVVPTVQDCRYDSVQTSTGKPATACRVMADYTFYATDGSYITATVAAEAWDNGDKAAPKAMSVAFRTALLQALALPTDEPDPDSQTYERANHAAPQPILDRTRSRLFAMFASKGIADDQQLAGINHICGTLYESRSQMTEEDARRVIEVLSKRPDVAAGEPREATE